MAALGFPDPPLTDDAVRLRPWNDADGPDLERAFADPVMRRFSWRTGPLDARDLLARQEAARLRGDAVSFALASPGADVLLGGVSLSEVRWEYGRAAVGFAREGVLRSHVPFQGTRRDSILFSLLPGELRDPRRPHTG